MVKKRKNVNKNIIINSPKVNYKREIVNELHKPARKNFKRRHVIIKGLNDLYQADLVEMIPYAKENGGFKYILVVINTFSKFVWAQPVKAKSATNVAEAMNKILKSSKAVPKNLQTDMGKEFYNKTFSALMEQFNINHYSTYSSMKASIVERVNRTLKSIMWKEFSFQGNYKWLKLLPEVVSKYNSTIHKTINMKPIDVKNSHERKLLHSAYNRVKSSTSVFFNLFHDATPLA